MTAIACLRLFIDDAARFGDAQEITDLVSRVAGAYLETTWRWPRRHARVAPCSFVLADPDATALDAGELKALSRDLQQRLFGVDGDGEVALVMFEGGQEEMMRFAGLSTSKLAAILAGEDDDPIAGRVSKITPTNVTSAPPKGPRVADARSSQVSASDPFTEESAKVAYRGLYHTGRQMFFGNVAVWHEGGAGRQGYGFDAPKQDSDVPEHDVPTLKGALDVIQAMDAGMMFLPICFSSIIKPSTRELLAPHLEALPKRRRGQLAAAVYDTPRAPSFWSIWELKSALDPHFSRIDLRVTDPAFQIDDLPADLATSVTLVLPKSGEGARLAAIKRFMDQAPNYRRRQVLQGIGDVVSKRELNACIDAGAPFLTGPGISELLTRPTESVNCPILHLPLQDWSLKEALYRKTP